MQTDLHRRDLIGDLDFSKEEVETVLDVAFDLKRKRALNELHPLLRDKVLAMLFFFSSTRTRGSFESGMAQLGGHAEFIESKTTQIAHGDTRDPGPLHRRARHPARRLEGGERLHPRGRRAQPGPGPEHAVRRVPP